MSPGSSNVCSLKYLDHMSLSNCAQLLLFYGESGDVYIPLQNYKSKVKQIQTSLPIRA